jgi:hypothetical protein
MAFNPRALYATDPQLELDGTAIDLGDGATVRIARFNNARHRAALDRLRKPYRSFTLAGRDIPDDIAERIAIDAMVEAILLGWDGFIGDDGQALPFSPEAARRLLTEVKDFRDQIAFLAMQAETFRRQAQADAGNASPPLPAGMPSGASI